MSKEYKINTVQDMIDCTNPDNLDYFISDLKALLQIAHELEIPVIKKDGYLWIDDNKKQIDVIVSDINKVNKS